MIIDCNDICEIELTDNGAEYLNNYFNELKQEFAKNGIDKDYPALKGGDKFRAQLWYIMGIFGYYMIATVSKPFKHLSYVGKDNDSVS